MKLLNFSLQGIELETAGITFDLHNHFVLKGYSRNTQAGIFELNFANRVYGADDELEDLPKPDLTLIFKQVSFLHIKDTAIDETNVCFNSMDFGEGLVYSLPQEFVESMPDRVVQLEENTFGLGSVENVDWQNFAYINCIWGVSILIAAETVEVKLS